MTQKRVTELRIHGMGGSPGPRLLGFRDEDDVRVVARRGKLVITKRAEGPPVEGFDWGQLTSGSPLHAFWVVLLPFTLLNVAGWAHAPKHKQAYPGQVRAHRALTALLGWSLTAAWALWLAQAVVGYAGYQWVPRAAGNKARILSLSWWHLTLTPKGLRVVGVALGLVLAAGLLFVVRMLGKRTQAVVNEPQSLGRAGADVWSGDETLANPSFFEIRGAWWASLWAHIVVSGGCFFLVGLLAIRALQASTPPERIPIDVALVYLALMQFALLVALGLLSWLVPRLRCRGDGDCYRPGRVATAAAFLSLTLTNAVFSGTVLWLVKYLGGHPKIAGSTRLAVGRDLAMVDVYLLVVVLWVAVLGVVAVWRSRLARLRLGRQPAPSLATAAAEASATITHVADRVLVWLAGVAVLAAAGIGLTRIEWKGRGRVPWHWEFAPPTTKGFAYLVAAWLLPAMVVFVVFQVRKAAGDSRARRFIGQVWDILTFWPRRFHPFAVRPYSQAVVPEFRAHIKQLADDGAVLVSAHSQGSVLAVATLAALDGDVLGRVALVTYGSPVAGIHRRAFPAYFNVGQVDALRTKLPTNGWHNFFRLTDPVGVPMFPVGQQGYDDCDHCLEDPADPGRTPSAPGDAPLERDRDAGAGLALHSYYLREPQLKRTVRDLKVCLAAPHLPPDPLPAAVEGVS